MWKGCHFAYSSCYWCKEPCNLTIPLKLIKSVIYRRLNPKVITFRQQKATGKVVGKKKRSCLQVDVLVVDFLLHGIVFTKCWFSFTWYCLYQKSSIIYWHDNSQFHALTHGIIDYVLLLVYSVNDFILQDWKCSVSS